MLHKIIDFVLMTIDLMLLVLGISCAENNLPMAVVFIVLFAMLTYGLGRFYNFEVFEEE